MKNKLLIIFDDDSHLIDIPTHLVFNNELDAQEYLLSTDSIKSIEIDPSSDFFKFKTNSWSGTGVAKWIKEIS